MEDRAKIPPGLPREKPTVSYWQQPPDTISNNGETSQPPVSADIVIVGSGISGASVAYKLLEEQPNLKIVMLEARDAASGASGRNGGHTKHASYRAFAENVKISGEKEAAKMAQFEYDCMIAVHEFIKETGINADSQRLDTVDIFYDKDQWRSAQDDVRLMQQVMGISSPVTDYRSLTKEEAASQLLIPDSFGALRYEAGSLSAYKLTIGILRMALEKGLALHTHTPVTKLEKNATPGAPLQWLIYTSRGVIKTAKTILATNGYTAHLLPQLQGTIMPFRGIVTAHRPGRKMPQTGLGTTYSFIYEKGYDYMISQPKGTRHEGDIVIGGGLTKGQGRDGMNEFGNTDDTIVDKEITKYLEQTTTTFFGKENWGEDHPDGRIRHAWSGIMGYSADGRPFVGPVPGEEGLYLDVSFQGHGMVLCFLCADALAKMVLGRDGPDLERWFPQSFRVTEERMKKKFRDASPLH